MASLAPRRTTFPAFAGVALADILANSVAIVIIMIVVTLLTRYEQEQDKLEQAQDVGVLLSREIAGSFVMNALPTSAPAQLHDYVSSPFDRNPQHQTMPIIELHDGHLRDFYTGTVYPREELLRPDNALDAYLGSLAPEQLLATRVDVYGIAEFYIAMSIFKAHGLQPRHWHFLGPQGTPAHGQAGGRWLVRAPRGAPADEAAGLGQGAARQGGAVGGPTSDDQALPEDVAVARFGGFDIHYPHDPLARSQAGGAGDWGSPANAQEEPLDLPGGAAGGESRAESASEQAPRALGQLPNIEGNRFRAAVPAATRSGIALGENFPMRDILRGLFAYMAELQAAADAGQPSQLPRYDFMSDVIARAARLPPPGAAEEAALRSLEFLMETPRARSEDGLDLVPQRDAATRGQALRAFQNEPLGRLRWLHDAAQPEPAHETDPAVVTLRLGSHAEVHTGLRMELEPGGVLLMPEMPGSDGAAGVADDAAALGWRVVTVVDAARSDFVTGFVYAGLDRAGRLLLPVDENAIEMNGLRVESRFPGVALRSESWRLLFYGTVGALFAAGVAARYWRRSA